MTQLITGVDYSNVSNPSPPPSRQHSPLARSPQTKDQLWQSNCGQFPLLNPSQFPHYNSISNRVTENSTNFLWNLSNGIPHNTTLYIQAPKCQRISIGLPIAKKEVFFP